MIGRTLSDRYKIVEKIGEGGMALVYKAKDSLLGRIVAVKVLRPQYTSDDEFIERFRREAKSAASLSHPNVVNIYDVGKDDQIYFIVMEYVDGENLKSIIKERAPMSATDVISIGRQIVEALEHAHRRDIVHRDIKPHNILVTREGRVKVTDFGIARAASVSSLTQTGMVVGSVHYFSPEQARGTSTGTQSDLYSVGVVLYEMITGTVPFRGDTPISVALSHIQDEAPPIRNLNPSAPAALERVISKALQKDLEKRYSSADIMLRDLYIAGAQAHDMEENETTKVVPAASEELVSPAGIDEPTLVRNKDTAIGEKRKKKDRPKWFLPAVISGSALLLILLISLLLPLLLYKPEVEVPDLKGKSLRVAENMAEERGLIIEKLGEQFSVDIPAYHIVDQRPPAGRIVKKGRHLQVVISKGMEKVVIPDLREKSLEEATTLITDASLVVGTTSEGYSDIVHNGLVMSQNPGAGTEVDKGSSVDLVISKGSKPVVLTLQSYVGMQLEEAKLILTEQGLSLGKVASEQSDTTGPGVILEQFPEAGVAVEKGKAINFVVSTGPENQISDTADIVPRRFEVKATVPEGPSEQEVKIIVADSLGTRTVYKKRHKPGDVISQVVEAHGTGKIEVYLNGELVKEDPV